MPEIKICGLTDIREAAFLNEAKADYAGFVFYEKSKRNVSITRAKEIAAHLNHAIQKTAVCVSPDAELVSEIMDAGFDILQVHGTLTKDVMALCRIPIWQAVNISGAKEMAALDLSMLSDEKITGVVVDGAVYGGGITFAWKDVCENRQTRELLENRKKKRFILAGGLNARNVAQGIKMFHPDIVDVSSGVEGEHGKEKDKIMDFVREVRKNG